MEHDPFSSFFHNVFGRGTSETRVGEGEEYSYDLITEA